MTEQTESTTEAPTIPSTPKAKKAAAKKRPAKPAKKKTASRASSKQASAPKKKRGKAPKHWSDTHAQLVVHAHPSLIAKLDKAISRLGKSLKLDRPTRGSIVRALVEKAVK
jgi:hypothetical protein